MAELTVQEIDMNNSLTPVYVLADALGDTFVNDGKTLILLDNTGASSMNFTIASQVECSQGATHNITANGLIDTLTMLGFFSTGRFNDVSGKVNISYSATGSKIWVAVVRII